MKHLLLIITLFLSLLTTAQNLKSPSEFLGYELGTQFTRHHQVVDYYEYLADTASDRVQLQTYGKTNEHRPLLLAYISSKENITNLEDIRKAHIATTEGQGNPSMAIVLA